MAALSNKHYTTVITARPHRKRAKRDIEKEMLAAGLKNI